jgi:hypothetical protein
MWIRNVYKIFVRNTRGKMSSEDNVKTDFGGWGVKVWPGFTLLRTALWRAFLSMVMNLEGSMKTENF